MIHAYITRPNGSKTTPLSERVANALAGYNGSSSTFSSAPRLASSAPPLPPPSALPQSSQPLSSITATLAGGPPANTTRRASLGDIAVDSGIGRGGVDSSFAAAQASRLEKLKQTAALASVGVHYSANPLQAG